MRWNTEPASRESFRYDALERLDNYKRKLALPTQQSWNLDAVGNWLRWDVRGSSQLHQTRTHSAADRIDSVKNLANEPQWAQPFYDHVGNMTEYPHPAIPDVRFHVRYDAWNRPVSIASENGYISETLQYDGLGRLVLKSSEGFPAETRRYTYSPDWQLLEEEVKPDGDPSYRYDYIWGIRGPDDLICRDKYAHSSGVPVARDYVLTDANGNIVGLVPTIGGGASRCILYDAYGQPLSGAEDLLVRWLLL